MKKAHIISHTHWDREWYLPYEKHHMLYIEMMDTLIDTMEKDQEYKYFHLDGQTIMLEDYLQVRPENRARLQKLIGDGRIAIGPWYVLQDEFLTSSESNVRNLQMGYKLAQEFGGKWTKTGYFPDSFGNVGQAPQLLKKAGIDTAVFGRGVKPTGFNNQTADAYESAYSEMNWQSADGSAVLGILFANWYNNGAEVPVEEEKSKGYWDKKLADAVRYAGTDQLLFMNGCDHQPVQTDLSAAIRTANALYPDVDFVHSDFAGYVEQIKKELPDDLNMITGELRSQKTDGWYTLANTASSRIYIKQWNVRCEMLFEKVAEPLAAIAAKEGMEYPQDLFTYGWKLLMQNHPHDSICGCSVDEVHREMITRFEKTEQVALHIISMCMDYLKGKINTSAVKEGNIPFVVVNTTGWDRTGVVEMELETDRMYFSEAPLAEVIARMHEKKLPEYRVLDKDGREIPAVVTEIANHFNYDLPKDKFRQPYIAKRVKITMEAADVPAFGWDTYVLAEAAGHQSAEHASAECINTVESLITAENTLENEFLKAHFEPDGSVELTDKKTDHVYRGLGIFEDCGDIGNEYIFFAPVNDVPVTTKGTKAEITVAEDNACRAVVSVKHTMMLPDAADETLAGEIEDLVEFKHRKASRGSHLVPFEIVTEYTLEKHGKALKVKTTFNNQIKDHRLRVLFETGLHTDFHYADSVFEVAKRPNVPADTWENPCNAQHQQCFVNVHEDAYGLTIANKGLAEYEILRDGKNTIAVTLHRGVRELGDWGVFLTPEAQCLGEKTTEYEIIPHGAGEELYHSYEEAYQFQTDWQTAGMERQAGTLPQTYRFVEMKHLQAVPTALKHSMLTGDVILRFCNLSDEETTVSVSQPEVYTYDLLEKDQLQKEENEIVLGKHEIRTIGWRA